MILLFKAALIIGFIVLALILFVLLTTSIELENEQQDDWDEMIEW